MNLEGPPPGHTGGFGEPTCLACHFGSGLNDPAGDLYVEGFPPTYRPGRTYLLTVRLAVPATSVAGFQAALRYAEGARRGRNAGTVEAVDGRVVAVTDSVGGVTYLQHAGGGAVLAPGTDVASWTFRWVAPRDPGTAVRLSVAANSGNGDNSPLGDLVYTLTETAARRD